MSPMQREIAAAVIQNRVLMSERAGEVPDFESALLSMELEGLYGAITVDSIDGPVILRSSARGLLN